MTITVIRTNKIIIVYKIFVSGIIRWINVDEVNPLSVRFIEQIQALQIIALKDKVIETMVTALIR